MKRWIQIILYTTLFEIAGHSQSIGIMAGRSVLPADYISLRYSHYSDFPINAALGIFNETSHTSGLNYTSYGMDVLGEYASAQGTYDNNVFGFKIGMGATIQIENEPWVYQSLSTPKKINFGLIGELTGEWGMSQNFCLSVFAQQKLLFNKSLGATRLSFGLGLKILLNNF